MLRKAVFLCGALLLFASASAFAFDPIDITGGGTVTSTVDQTIWSSNITQPTGTGVYQPFLRIQASPDEEGFNTDYSTPFPLDDKPPVNFTHSVTWGSLATININGTDYYSFQLDANEPQSGTESLISLDKLRIYNSTDPALQTLSGLGNPLYDLDGTSDQTIFIDTALKPGSGTDDLTLYIPKSFFANVNPNDYMVFYTQFGLSEADAGLVTDATFEEWRAAQNGTPDVPEPTTMVLLGSGLLGMVGFRRKKK